MINEDQLVTIKMDKVVLKMDPETEIIYVGKCSILFALTLFRVFW